MSVFLTKNDNRRAEHGAGVLSYGGGRAPAVSAEHEPADDTVPRRSVRKVSCILFVGVVVTHNNTNQGLFYFGLSLYCC
jgi:hypothetical protein